MASRKLRLTILILLVCVVGYGTARHFKLVPTSFAFASSRSVEEHQALALDAYNKGDIKTSLFHWEKMLEIQPGNAGAHLSIANIYQDQTAEKREDRFDPPEAIPHLEALTPVYQQNPAIRRRLALAVRRLGKDDLAFEWAQASMRRSDRSSELVYFTLEHALKKGDKAETDDTFTIIGRNLGFNSPVLIRFGAERLRKEGRGSEVSDFVEKKLELLSQEPPYAYEAIRRYELVDLRTVLSDSIKLAPGARKAAKRLLDGMKIIERIILSRDPGNAQLFLVETAALVVDEFSGLYPHGGRIGENGYRSRQERSIANEARREALRRLVRIAVPILEDGRATPRIFEPVARAAMQVEDKSRTITLLREGIRLLGELPSDLKGELLSLHRDAALKMIARRQGAPEDDVAPLMKSEETASLGHLLAGFMALERGRLKDAERHIEAARRDENIQTPARAMLIRIYLSTRRWEMALELLEDLNENWIELPAAVRTWLRKAYGGRNSLQLMQAFCYLQLNQPEPAHQLLTELETGDFRDEARTLRAIELTQRGHRGEAVALLREARLERPDNFNMLIADCGLLVGEGQIDLAARHLSAYVVKYPEDLRGRIVLSRLYDLLGNAAQAITLLHDTISRFPTDPVSRVMMGELLLRAGRDTELDSLLQSMQKPETAEQILLLSSYSDLRRAGLQFAAESLLQDGPSLEHESSFAIAAAMSVLARGEIDWGFTLITDSLNLAPVRPRVPHQLLSDLESAVETDDVAEVTDQVRKLLKKYPDEPVVIMAAAEIASQAGDAEKALQHIDQLEQHDPVPGRPELLRSHFLRFAGRSNEAIDSLEHVLSISPRNHRARLLVAELEHRRGNDERVLEHLSLLPPAMTETINVSWLQASSLARLGETTEAELRLRELIRRAPERPEFYFTLIRLLQDKNRTEDALAMLQFGLNHLPDNEKMHRNFIELLASAGQVERLEQAIRSFAGSSPTQDQCLMLARVNLETGNLQSAEAWLKQAQAMQQGRPGDNLLFVEAMLAHQKGTHTGYHSFYVQARLAYQRLLKQTPDHVPTMNNLAWLLLLKFNEAEEAADLADQMRDEVPVQRLSPENLDTIAEMLRQTGRVRDAMTLVTESLERHPDSAALRFQYGALLFEDSSEDKEARQLARDQLVAARDLGTPQHHASELEEMLSRIDRD